jgi:hypothetical protein
VRRLRCGPREELHIHSRAIFVLDKDDTRKHAEYVKEVGTHPDCESALAVAKKLVGEAAAAFFQKQKRPVTEVTGRKASKGGKLYFFAKRRRPIRPRPARPRPMMAIVPGSGAPEPTAPLPVIPKMASL